MCFCGYPDLSVYRAFSDKHPSQPDAKLSEQSLAIDYEKDMALATELSLNKLAEGLTNFTANKQVSPGR